MQPINILLIGSGGREHALAWKMKQSAHCAKLYCAPGNAGIAQVAECVDIKGEAAILDFCKKNAIGLVVIGPEQPLVDGLADALRAANIPTFGPSKLAAQLEGSKDFTKALCKKYNIPTAAYETFTALEPALAYIDTIAYPHVIKADGLAAGKGVIIAQNKDEAALALRDMFGGAFGAAGSKVVIEEFLEGTEVSFFALADGKTVRHFATAQDHKRAFDGDKGPNTGGMGTFSPSPLATPEFVARVMREIIEPSAKGMHADGIPFEGMFFAGLMVTKEGPKLLEYNTRFGDPETQSMLMRLESDLVELLYACATKTLETAPLSFSNDAAICVVMAANGYPGEYQKGTQIRGLERAKHVTIFHAGTVQKEGKLLANGGRVLGICARGNTMEAARNLAYADIALIDWPEGFYRKDIGKTA